MQAKLFSRLSRRDVRDLEHFLQKSAAEKFYIEFQKFFWRCYKNFGKTIKRSFDVVIALIALIVFSPVMLIVALIIKATDKGPVLFWQTRVGMWGQTFKFPKFRSMVMNAEALQAKLVESNAHGQSITFKMRKDPRVTWIGRFIRKTSIDELPQLWCVLTGDMSIVGPRPPLVREVLQYSLSDRRRLDITPGLTCTWQVSGRADIPFQQQLSMDIEYIKQQSLWADLKILLKTIPAVIIGRGAY